jgi:hypothetical protein
MVAQRTSQLPTTFEVSADRLPLCCSPGVYKVVDDLDATARAATYLNGRLVALLEATIFLDDKFGWCGKDGHV